MKIDLASGSRGASRLLLGIALVAAAGCRESNRGGAESPTKAKTAATKAGPISVAHYPLTGIVRAVAPEKGQVLIRHREIPGFMKAMTMPFEPADPSILGLLNPGDQVEGRLRVEKQDGAVLAYQLLDLKVIQPAKPASQVLDVSRGKILARELPHRLEVGETVPDFVMTGQDGKSMKLSELRGKVIVLTFIYTRCPMPDFCPAMDRRFSDLDQHLKAFPKRAKDIRLVSLSFDPENDTPEVLRKHAAIRGASPPLWTYAVASHDELAKIAPRLGLLFEPDGKEITHNLCTAVIDPQGKLARLAVGTQENRWETAQFLKTIYSFLPAGDR